MGSALSCVNSSLLPDADITQPIIDLHLDGGRKASGVLSRRVKRAIRSTKSLERVSESNGDCDDDSSSRGFAASNEVGTVSNRNGREARR